MIMNHGSVEPKDCATSPVLVLGLGNPLLADDGVGLEILERLKKIWGTDPQVEFLDGGTQGISLVAYFTSRRAVLILDAAAFGKEPGTIHVIKDPQNHATPRGIAAHEGNAGEILAAAALLGDLPEHVTLVGLEPAEVKTRMSLSEATTNKLDDAAQTANEALKELVKKIILQS